MPLTRRSHGRLILAAAATAVAATAGPYDPACAQGIRDRTRPTYTRDSTVDESQAAAITLTVAPVARQMLQTWVRTAAVLDDDGKTLHACVPVEEGRLLMPDMRVRAFPPDSKSSIYQARIRSVTAGAGCTAVDAALSGPVYGDETRFVVEIVVDRGRMLAVPNSAIIEREGKQVVYVQLHPGHYDPREIRTGLKGEIYSEVLEGVSEGSEVVTIGSFFIDAEYRLTMSGGNGMHAHQHR